MAYKKCDIMKYQDNTKKDVKRGAGFFRDKRILLARAGKPWHLVLVLVLVPLILFCPEGLAAQNGPTVQGIVISGDNQETMPGVNILVKGTNIGTTTDGTGSFTIQMTSPRDTLLFSFVGYQRKEVLPRDQIGIEVVMQPLTIVGEEFVVIGYGGVRRRDLTGSVSSVSADAFENTTASSFDQVLQGRATGLTVTRNTGQPGGGVSVQVRGINTLSGDSEPLYVIDGVPFSGNEGGSTNALATLNPSDIESVEVLKDASASAIYGARAANGVILITTKSGLPGQLNVDYNMFYGLQELPARLDVMTLREQGFFMMERERVIGWESPWIYQNPELLGEGTNWQEELFRSAPMMEHNLSFSGGSENTRYRMSMGYFNQEGIAIGSGFERYSLRLNLDNSPVEWLQLGSRLNISQAAETITVSERGVIRMAIRQSPHIPVRMPDGGWGGPDQAEFELDNPVALASINQDDRKRTQLNGNMFASVDFNENINWRSEFIFGRYFSDRYEFEPTFEFGSRFRDINAADRLSTSRTFLEGKSFVTVNQAFGSRLRTTNMAGFETRVNEFENLSGARQRFPGNTARALSAGDDQTSSISHWSGSNSMLSFFGRINLNYDSRYLLTSSFRADASSRFGENNRWGYFPSVAGAWTLSNESFFPFPNTFNELKFRLGYGFVGNESIGNYMYGAVLGVVPTGRGSGVRHANIANPDLKWESTESVNAGVDIAILRNRIRLSFDAYLKWTNNLLLAQPLPLYAGVRGTAGIGAPIINVGSLENRGFEIDLKTINLEGNFRWETDIVFSVNRNQVTRMDQETSFIERTIDHGSTPVSRTIIGQPVGQFYGYVVEGMFLTEEDLLNHARQADDISRANGSWLGDLMFKDINGDGVIDERDRVVIGDPNPDFTFGISNRFFFSNFDLNVFINGSYGNDIFNNVRRFAENPGERRGLLSVVSDFARVEKIDPEGPDDLSNLHVVNPETSIPRIVAADPNGNQRVSDRFVEDGSYIRIKNVTLGYNMQPMLMNWLNVRSFRIYASVENLWTLTGYSGFDPEVGALNQDTLLMGVDDGRYPSQRIYTFGINIGL